VAGSTGHHPPAGGADSVEACCHRGVPGQRVSAELARQAADVARAEIAPISDVRGSADYKRLLLGQLVLAHLHVLCGINSRELAEVAG
jgi:xanthine dehydrogenase iron-sulfur cluster and FAD-binding subunit A